MFKLKDFYPNQASFIGIKEPVKEAVYQFKGYTRKDLDEFDAMAHRAGFRETPDFNKMTYTTDEISRKLDKIVKSKGGKKIRESVNEANVIQKIDKLAKRNKYGTVDGTQMNGKTAREIMAIFKHPKMNSYRNQMLGMKSHELVDLTLRLLKPLKINVESIGENEMVKLKNLLVEKKELGGAMIDKIYNLTDRNAHNMARETLAKAMGNKKLLKAYEAINALHTFFYDMNDLMDARHRLDKMLFAQAKKMYSDYEQIYSAF